MDSDLILEVQQRNRGTSKIKSPPSERKTGESMATPRPRVDWDAVEDHPLVRKSLMQRIKEDPLVPMGCLVTTLVLLGGLGTFSRGQSKLGNKFMQARVAAQTATVFAVAGGAYYTSQGKKEHRKKPYEDRLKIELRGDEPTQRRW